MNRPQFVFPTPPGFEDMAYVRPVLIGQDITTAIPVGQYLDDYVVQFDSDAPTIIRSLFIEGIQQSQYPNLQIRLRDAFGNYLTDGFVPLWLYATGAGSTPPDGGSGRTKVFEPEIYCPPGSTILIDFYNPG